MKLEWKTCFRAGLTAFLLFLCIFYWDSVSRLLALTWAAAAPVLVGCCVAYVINIMMSFLERHFFPKSQKKLLRAVRRPLCLVLSFLAVIAVITAVVLLVVPELTHCVQLLVAQVPPTLEKLTALVSTQDMIPDEIKALLSNFDWKQIISTAASFFTQGVTGVAGTAAQILSSVVTWVMAAAIGLILSIYLLLSKEKLKDQFTRLMKSYLKPKWVEKIFYVCANLNHSFHHFIVGQCTEAVIFGVMVTVCMFIFQFPYAPMIGAMMGFCALIPIVGAYVGAAVGFLLILTVSPLKAVLFLVMLVVLTQIEGNLIYPRVVGSSLGLPPFWILASITVGGSVFGIPGMLLGVPVVSALYRMTGEALRKREAQHPPKP